MKHNHQHAHVHDAAEIDPVCGMTVDPAHAAGSSRVGDTTYYFCSASCKQKFNADPAAYIGGKHPEPKAAPAGATYVCPMDPEVRQDKPGACPKCGMALEPEMVAAPAGAGAGSGSPVYAAGSALNFRLHDAEQK